VCHLQWNFESSKCHSGWPIPEINEKPSIENIKKEISNIVRLYLYDRWFVSFADDAGKSKWRGLGEICWRQQTKHSNVKGRSGEDGGVVNKPKWAYFNMTIFFKDVVSSSNFSVNIPPLEESRKEINMSSGNTKNWKTTILFRKDKKMKR